jgi:hypothetical protein
MVPARLTANSACRGFGLTARGREPWASPILLRTAPREGHDVLAASKNAFKQLLLMLIGCEFQKLSA